MPGATIDGVVLDHVAHAVHRWQDVWHRYAVDLGAAWSSGGLATGFAPGQIEFANRARLELLMPNDVEANDFLHRFLTRNGPGPHHLTFKVPDLALAIEQIRQAGYDPIGIDLTRSGVDGGVHPSRSRPPGSWSSWPRRPTHGPVPHPTVSRPQKRQRRDGTGPVRPGSLRFVTHAVAELDEATPALRGTARRRGDRPRGSPAITAGWSCPGAARWESAWSAPSAIRRPHWATGSAAAAAGSTISSSTSRIPGRYPGPARWRAVSRSVPTRALAPPGSSRRQKNEGMRLVLRDG